MCISRWILDLECIQGKWSQCQGLNAVRKSYHQKNSDFQLSFHLLDKASFFFCIKNNYSDLPE